MAYQTADLVNVPIGQSEPEPMMQQTVSGDYFAVLGVQPALGRLISPEDDRAPGRQPVAVIGDGLWKSRFQGSPMAVGSKLQFGGQVFDIVGVAPPQFFGVEVGKVVEVWTPISMAPAAMRFRPLPALPRSA